MKCPVYIDSMKDLEFLCKDAPHRNCARSTSLVISRRILSVLITPHASKNAIACWESNILKNPVNNHRTIDFGHQSVGPPSSLKSLKRGKNVSRQNVDAYPGHEAEFFPLELIYQLEQLALKTVSLRSACTPAVKLSSASCLTSIIDARLFIIGLNRLLTMNSAWTSVAKITELWAGNEFGPKLYHVRTFPVKIICKTYSIAKLGKLCAYVP